MSRGTQLQEMEVKTQQSKTAVNANAKPGDPMPTMADPGTRLASVEDLGGPTPENSKPDDDSNKLKTPGATLKQVKDIVNKNAKPADPMPAGMKEEEAEVEGEVVSEQDTDEDLGEISENQEDDLHNKVEKAITEEPAEEEEVVAEDSKEEIDVSADVEALLQGEELSEEFQTKAKTIFEAAINSKVDAIQEELEKVYSEKLAEEIESTKTSLTERVDSYLEYVADEWLHENQLAVDQGLKAEMSESFMTGLKGLFEEHYVSVPEEKYDVLESMVNKLDEMESKLNEQIDKNIALNKRLSESTSDGILSDVSEGLAVTQKEKLASLAESVEFESEENYREKLVTLRNSYFPNSAPSAQRDNTEFIAEGTSNDSTKVAGNVAKYVDALQRFSKK